MSIAAAADTFRQGLSDLRSNPDKRRGLASGIPGLDSKVAFGPGDLVTVASRTSVGKTSVILQFVQAACEQLLSSKSDQAVALVSAELPAPMIVQRLVASGLNVPSFKLANTDETVVDEYLAYLKTWPLHIMDRRGPNTDQIHRWLMDTGEKIGGEAPFAMMVMDHLGRIQVPGGEYDIYRKTSRLADDFQDWADEWQTALVMAAQVNRSVEQRISRDPKTDKVDVSMTRPLPSDIEGSGKVEQNSKVCLMLWREERYLAMTEQREEREGPLEINVAKNHGPTGFVKVNFTPELTKLQGTTHFHSPPSSAAALKVARAGVLRAALKGASALEEAA